MPSAAVKAAVEAKLADWVSLFECPYADENETSNSPIPQYLSIEYPVSNEDRISVGKPGLFRESGGIRFVVHVLNQSGLADGQRFTDELRDLFRDQIFGGVMTFAASPPALDRSNRVGAYYVLPFVVRYQFDIVR